jgi:hypothetical protein
VHLHNISHHSDVLSVKHLLELCVVQKDLLDALHAVVTHARQLSLDLLVKVALLLHHVGDFSLATEKERKKEKKNV